MPNNRRFSDKQEAEILSLYLSGATSTSIAKQYKTRSSQIRRAISRQNGQMRTRTEYRRKYLVDESAFDILTPESAYWIGFLMADGCVTDSRGNECSPLLVLGLADKDRGHIASFREFLKSTHPITNGPVSSGTGLPSARICIASKRLVAALSVFGIVPRKSLTATVPTILLQNRDFWRGVVDGDGTIHIGKKKNGTTFPTISLVGSHALVEQFSNLVRLLSPGCKAKATPKGNISKFSISSNIARTIISYLYCDSIISLPRKSALAAESLIPLQPKEFCINGHPFVPENRRPTNGGRTTYCVACRRA